MPVTENPELDSVEIWNLINMTDDAHSDSSSSGAFSDTRVARASTGSHID